MGRRPTVLFLCVHNAGRSQMAAGLMERHAAGAVDVRTAGSEPAERLHPGVVAAMAEVGIDLTGRAPRGLDPSILDGVDVVVTMGCGDACPAVPGARYEDWELDDPAGLPVEAVRPIRDDVDRRVRTLLDDLAGS